MAGRSIAGRYTVLAELGRGGMGHVLRVRDSVSQEELALKQLTLPAESRHARELAELFEREFHTLVQLSHPRVIRVYDFGIEAGGAYYTMELLDGGDLNELAPLPWRTACELIFDVSSSLALMHSRRLVHRDVSPRNVRCTHDGHAKLIDFGAMIAMGTSARLVGTAPFVAPEAFHGSVLDARTDLFSLGATLYFALTGRLAYPARDFSRLLEVWSSKPVPPSAVVAEIPAALDELVLSLIGLEPAHRPRSAFEVMQRLSTIAGIHRQEPLSVSKAYLLAPSLVGRDEPLATFHERVQRAQAGRGGVLWFEAAAGLGRSRMLDACALAAKMSGACVVHSSGSASGREDLTGAHVLATQLVAALPEAAPLAARAAHVFDVLFEPDVAPLQSTAAVAPAKLKSFARSTSERPLLQRALTKWFRQLVERQPLVLVVDDADELDEPSLALLATLAARAPRRRVLLVVSCETTAHGSLSAGLSALRARSEVLALRALSEAETELLLGSMFGDVPNLALASARIHAAAAGNPRQIMVLAQLLIDREVIRYQDGSWTLRADVATAELPSRSEEVLRARLANLSPLALRLAQAQALYEHGAFTRDDYRLLAPDAEALDDTLEELCAQQVVTCDGETYRLTWREAAAMLGSELSAAEVRAHHAALAELYLRSGRSEFAAARHLLLAGRYEAALDRMTPLLRKTADRVELAAGAGLSVHAIGLTLEHALRICGELRRHPREQNELRQWLLVISVADDDAFYSVCASDWLAQLEQDSGLVDFRSRSDIADPLQRLQAALQAAAQRHAQTPATEAVYPPDQAIRLLVHYVAISIAIGVRTVNVGLLTSLPKLLEPYAPLSPLAAAMWQNALATCESICARQPERANTRWIAAYERLGQIDAPNPHLVRAIRNAIAYGIGYGLGSMGLQSALHWAEVLDRDPLQKVSAMYLRKVARLQQGDLEGAERYRKQAELLALQSDTRQMFTFLLTIELDVHFAAWDLTGVKQIAEQIAPLAERNPGWKAYVPLAEGHYQCLRGDLNAALQAYEHALELARPDPSDPLRAINAWPDATAAYAEVLIKLGRAAEAKALAAAELVACEQRDMPAPSQQIVRVLALAEAKLGEYPQAAARLEALLDAQRTLGVTGLGLGASFEARTRVALWAGDRAAVERFARLTAIEYRHGQGSTLGARYERLMAEVRDAGLRAPAPSSVFEASLSGIADASLQASATVAIARAMADATQPSSRAESALRLLCQAHGAPGGHLFLNDAPLRLAASLQLDVPDDALQQRVRDFWSQQSGDDELETAAQFTASSSEGFSRQGWLDVAGTYYQPMLVSGQLDGAFVRAGVALLIPNPTAGHDLGYAGQLLAELARFLICAGDCAPA